MYKVLLTTALLTAWGFTTVNAQETLAVDQNPAFAVSRAKYMAVADSINQWHGITHQQTYKAFDWYEQKMERRNDRRQFRRDLRMERAKRSGYYRYNGNRSYYNPYYQNRRYNNSWFNWWF